MQERFDNGIRGGVYVCTTMRGGLNGYSKYRQYDTGEILMDGDIFDFTAYSREVSKQHRFFQCIVIHTTWRYVDYEEYDGHVWVRRRMLKTNMRNITFDFTEETLLETTRKGGKGGFWSPTHKEQLLEGCILASPLVVGAIPTIDDAYYGEYAVRFPKQQKMIQLCLERNIPTHLVVNMFQSFVEEATDALSEGDVIKWCADLKKLFQKK